MGEYVYGASFDSKGNIRETETSAYNGVLQEIAKVTKDNGSVDIYVDKTWDKC